MCDMDGQTIAAWAGILVAGALGVGGIVMAKRANDHAGTSADAAAAAVKLAEAADARADRLERVKFERSDVAWEPRFDLTTRCWVIENIGQDTAYDVRATATCDDVEEVQTASDVARRAALRFDISAAVAALRRRDATERGNNQSGIVPTGGPTIKIGHRVTWRSEAGIGGSHVRSPDDVRVDQ